MSDVTSMARPNVKGEGAGVRVEPGDEHNERLMGHVHPGDWVNPEPAENYNLVVIGAGAAGLITAAGAAGLGAKVAIVERHLMGGDCLNVGCVPSKALIRCARAAADVRRAGKYGVRVEGNVTVDFGAVMERMRKLRSGIAPVDSVERYASLGVDVFLGDAEFKGKREVEVDGKVLRFTKACIATGARAAAPPIEGLEAAGHLTNETIFTLTELPKRLAVIGAGPIGCELAQSFARFGSEVSLIEASSGVLPREDRDAAGIVEEALVRDGVKLICGGKAAKVEKRGEERVIYVECGGEKHEIVVDEIMVAVGRKPNVDGLGLEAASVRYDGRRGVEVDDQLRTSNQRIFAAGDVCSKYQFTHMADAMARIVIQNALFGFIPFVKGKVSRLVVPWATYTDPEIAHVGKYGHELEEEGVSYETMKVGLDDVDRAILEGETEGFLKVHYRKGKDEILGATMVGRGAGDMISEATLGMVNGVGLKGYAGTIHPYPTVGEVFRKAGDGFNRTRLSKRTKRIFEKLMAWQR